MASTGDFQRRIIGSFYFIPLFLGIMSGFPYAAVAGGAAIMWLAFEASLILTGALRTKRAALMWLFLILPYPLAFVSLSGSLIILIWLILYGGVHYLNRWREAGFLGLLMLASISLGMILSKQNGHLVLLCLATVISAGDIGAYLFGRLFGGPKLAPSISPSKTWTGAFGGLICSLVAVCILSFVLDVSLLEPAGWVSAVMVSVLAQLGDLFESRVKRRLGIKDSGSFVPGHGGALDRFDGYLSVLPLVFVSDFIHYTPFWLKISAS